jgi:hypothetical protein
VSESRIPSRKSGTVVLEVHGWHTQCGDCGYGRGGWAASPALKNPPGEPLSPDSRVCHGCGKAFTHVLNIYTDLAPRPIEPEATASA